MSFTISINDQAAFEVLFAGPAGPTGPQGIQGIQGVPGPGVASGGTTGQVLKKLSSTNYDTGWSSDISGVAWGGITGTLSSQTDLQNALDAKLSTSAASSTYLPLAGGYITGDIQSTNGSGYRTWDGGYNTAVLIPAYLQFNNSNTGGNALTVEWNGITFADGKQTVRYPGISILDGYATESWVTTQLGSYLTTASAALTYYPLTNPDNFITTSALTPYLLKSGGFITGDIQSSNGSMYKTADAGNFSAIYGPAYLAISNAGVGGGTITVDPSGILFASSPNKQTAPFLGLDGYATELWVDTYYAPIAAGQPVSGTVGQVLTKNSGTDYDSSWATLIPGDRYLTTSTTSLTINNANKTLTVGTGLSYTPQQDVVIAYDANNHMHAQVLTYNSGTGVMTVDVRSHTGTGTFAVWTVNVGGTVPAASIVWGDITGVLGNQTDLATALNGKLETTTAASTYFTIASAAGKANLSGATFTGKVNLATISVATPSINLGGQCDSAPASAANGDLWISNAAAPKLTYKMGGVNYNLPVLNQFNTFTNQMVIDTTSSATAALRVTQRGTGNAITVEDSTTPDATAFVVDQHGKVGIGVAPDTTAALKVDTNGIMFGDGTTQTTASSPFTGGAVTSAVTATNSGNEASFNYNAIELNIGSLFRAGIYNDGSYAGLAIYSGGSTPSIYINGGGVQFPDSSYQTTAGIPDAPSDGSYYVRQNGSWVALTTVQVYDSNSNLVNVFLAP